MRFSQLAAYCLTASSLVCASAVPRSSLDELEEPAVPNALEVRQASPTSSQVPDSVCTNGPNTRACWKNGYSIATDFDQKFPTTGNTVTYWLTVTNTTCNPDGSDPNRACLLINGTYPGPVLRATWGDRMIVYVTNKMQDNGTSMHWHGVRQYNSVGADGVNGITECPIAPGDTKKYDFLVTQFGTSWYHSHYSAQYGDGVVGTMIFDGPATGNYQEDLGVYTLNEWYYSTAYAINSISSQLLQQGKPPLPGDTILINGTNKNPSGGGSYNQVNIVKGKKYRLRLANIGADNYVRVSLDNHTMSIIASDFIPVKPTSAQWILLGVGQRYDVVITANQAAGNYWFRALVATDCLSGNKGSAKAIWTYQGVTQAEPTTSQWPLPASLSCLSPSPLTPYWYQPVPPDPFTNQRLNLGFTKQVIVPGGSAITVWALNTTSLNIKWDKPTLTYLMDGNTSYPADAALFPASPEGKWNYWLIQTLPGLPPVPHPIHLHGHDFFVIGSGPGQYNASTATMNWDTPPRRDTETLPGGGWLALAFESNNPGAWLMHCHIAWHISQGLGVQFLEGADKIVYPDRTEYQKTCNNWQKYSATAYWHKDDSGL